MSEKRSEQTPWKLKTSGRPINLRGKREGVLLADGETIELPSELWAAYSGRNVHGDRPVLKKGDLVWLEPAVADLRQIRRAKDVKSIQWARWGKRGQALKDKIPLDVLPDDLHGDGLVDRVTDLFGQVASERGIAAPSFAARVRPENPVFPDAAAKLEERVTLAPLAPPHPGCLAFYRKSEGPDTVPELDDLRGYKVYRTTEERGDEVPWLCQTQIPQAAETRQDGRLVGQRHLGVC